MKTYINRGMVYETEVCGKIRTCLHEIIIRETMEELENELAKERKITGLNLRLEEVETW